MDPLPPTARSITDAAQCFRHFGRPAPQTFRNCTMLWKFDASSSGKLVLTGGLGLYGIMVACNTTFLCIVGVLFIPFLCFGLLVILLAFCACSNARRAMRKLYITLDSKSGYMSVISQGEPEVRVPLTEVDCADIINRSHTAGSSHHHSRRSLVVTVLIIKKMDGSHIRTNTVDAVMEMMRKHETGSMRSFVI
jgi:hypothetical protein